MDKLDLEAIDCARTQLGIDRTHAFACMVSPCTCSANAEDQRDMEAIARLTTLKRHLQSHPQAGTGAPGVREWILTSGNGRGMVQGPYIRDGIEIRVREVAPDKQAQKDGA